MVALLGCGAAAISVANEGGDGCEDVFVYDCADFWWKGEEVAIPPELSGGFPGC